MSERPSAENDAGPHGPGIPPAVPRLTNACSSCGDCYHPSVGPNTDGEPCEWCRDCGCHEDEHTRMTRVTSLGTCGCPVSGFGYRHHRHPCPRAGENESVTPPGPGHTDA